VCLRTSLSCTTIVSQAMTDQDVSSICLETSLFFDENNAQPSISSMAFLTVTIHSHLYRFALHPVQYFCPLGSTSWSFFGCLQTIFVLCCSGRSCLLIDCNHSMSFSNILPIALSNLFTMSPGIGSGSTGPIIFILRSCLS